MKFINVGDYWFRKDSVIAFTYLPELGDTAIWLAGQMNNAGDDDSFLIKTTRIEFDKFVKDLTA